MFKSTALALAFLFTLALFISCDEDNSTEPTDNQSTLTMSHWGVDWSEGIVGGEGSELDYENSDGETIAWCPNGNGGGWETGVWYRTVTDKMYKMGNGDLDDYSKIDESRWDDDVCDSSLNNGDVWGAECRDGYVIFKVKEQPDPKQQDWAVNVDYKFSETTQF